VADKTVIEGWQPEDEAFWDREGKRVAARTLSITTLNLTLSFITWFVVSALVVRLPNIGFQLSDRQLFWLAAMPGLSGGTLRILHTFLIPLYGTRRVVTISTLSLLIPLAGWAFAVQHPETSFEALLVLAALAGFGGGNFSSFMPSTSLFYPKRRLGTALGIQAGIGNFGVSVVQFVTPWVIGFALVGGSQVLKKGATTTPVWLQNATAIWIPLVVIGSVAETQRAIRQKWPATVGVHGTSRILVECMLNDTGSEEMTDQSPGQVKPTEASAILTSRLPEVAPPPL